MPLEHSGGMAAAALIVTLALSPASVRAAPKSPDADVCRLISVEAAQKIVGRPVTTAAAEADNGGSACVYEASPAGPVVMVSLLDTTVAAVATEESNAKETPVPELGPTAFWSTRYLALHVQAPNNQVIRISLNRTEGSWSGTDLKTLATRFAAEALKGFGAQ